MAESANEDVGLGPQEGARAGSGPQDPRIREVHGPPGADPTRGEQAEAEQAHVEPAEVRPAQAGDDEPGQVPAPEEPGQVPAADELRVALAEAQRVRDEYLDHLRRERAEFENFRRRTSRERMDALDRGAEALVANLLGVLDNFGFALEAAEESDDDRLAKGVQMVHTELMAVLRQAGLQEVPGVGEVFDPAWHEAVMQVEAEQPVDEPVVVEVLRPGYRFKGRVLRPASVTVAR
ncbi:MAG: nucleotide exchange factor GrpE [Actinomycetota bacterium]|nr:nucleotide exchange factor GrpE [Actinomycetota bacterium]